MDTSKILNTCISIINAFRCTQRDALCKIAVLYLPLKCLKNNCERVCFLVKLQVGSPPSHLGFKVFFPQLSSSYIQEHLPQGIV